MNITEKIITIPRGVTGLAPLEIDLTNVYRAEGRIPEVAFVTPQKAPELLAVFIDAYASLAKHIVAVDFERSQAERAANKLRAIILLDKVPTILKDKGLTSARSPSGSEDLRKAILDSDEEYTSALDKIDQLNALVELIKGKSRSVEMAYTSVKKIIGENAYNFRNTNLSGPAESPKPPVLRERQTEETLPTLGGSVRSGFGTPKY